MKDEKVTDIILYEIREVRSDISDLRKEIARLDRDVFSNKVKLGMIMATISLFTSIIVIVVAEKLKTLIT